MHMPAMSGLYLVIFSRALIGAILLTAGALKLRAPSSFAAVVAGFKILPRRIYRPVAFSLPVVECVIGGSLLAAVPLPDRAIRWASVPAGILFLSFATAVAINLLRGRRDISCGCFGVREGEKISWDLVVRNVFLCAVALLALPQCPAALGMPDGAYRRMDAVLLAISVLLAWLLSRAILQLWRYGRDLAV
jgi:hypothetical protein